MFGNVIQSIRIEFAGIPAGFCEALSTRECGKRSDANPISVPCSAFAKAQSLVEFREFVLQPSQFPDLTLVRHRSLAKYHERSPAMSNYHSANKPPFGPLAAIIHRREPNDIQYIEKMRTTLRWWDRSELLCMVRSWQHSSGCATSLSRSFARCRRHSQV